MSNRFLKVVGSSSNALFIIFSLSPIEINKAREITRPTIDEWLKIAGPNGKQILDIAANYAGGAKIMLKK